MREGEYYSVRSGVGKSTQISLDTLKKLFKFTIKNFNQRDYFHEFFGYVCTDAGFVEGRLGDDENINAKLLLKIGKEHLWPICRIHHWHSPKIDEYTEDDLFDVIEFLYDCVSIPSNGYYHSWNNCGYHDYQNFDHDTAKDEYRKEVNELLARYQGGYSLDQSGNIILLVELGFEGLFQASLPSSEKEAIVDKVELAKKKFLSRNLDQRREAIRELGDVLEYLRQEVKSKLVKKDESDLFEILNNFGIRHHNKIQKTDYDKSIFYSWMFYYYLASIHALERLAKKA
jgi:hypothetical protein